jgi:hypothetical protein
MEQKTKLTFEEWKNRGKEIFGTEDRRLWKFKCPACGFIQSFEDFIKAGATEEETFDMIGFSCVGRVMKEKGQFLQDKKQPCNYAGGGLFRLNPLTIITSDGLEHSFFDFAELNTKELVSIPPNLKRIGYP